jgi:hypothetical protein
MPVPAIGGRLPERSGAIGELGRKVREHLAALGERQERAEDRDGDARGGRRLRG